MNKFVLKVFVILVIGMAELPSIFGCKKSGNRRVWSRSGAATRSVDAVDNVFELEMEGFSICNTDGTEGLTFDEINACRVSCNFTHDTRYIPNCEHFGISDPFGRVCDLFLAYCF